MNEVSRYGDIPSCYIHDRVDNHIIERPERFIPICIQWWRSVEYEDIPHRIPRLCTKVTNNVRI